MPTLTESSVSPYNRSSARIRESCDEAPRSKRMCSSSDVRACGLQSIEKMEVEKRSQSAEEVDLDAFGPGTPTKDGEQCEPTRKISGGWDVLEFPFLERVTRLLSASDLCRLSQVI